MVTRDELTSYLDRYVAIHDIDDASWNGLQVEGANEVTRIATAVTAGLDAFEKAIDAQAQYLIVHHGHFWSFDNPSLTDWKKKRVQTLLRSHISLYAAHLPLDRHEKIGNNAQLLKLIGADISGEFFHTGGTNVSWWGELQEAADIRTIQAILETELFARCTTLPFGPNRINTVAVITGAGGYKAISQAQEIQVDLVITGDTAEIYHVAKDAGINVIFAGHHATEILGVRELGKHLESTFDIQTTFIDIPTSL